MAYQNNGQQQKQKYEHRVDRGSMFENDHKTTDKHPDFTGSVNVGGKIFWISGWKEMTASNRKKISLSVKLQEERPQDQNARPTNRNQRPASW